MQEYNEYQSCTLEMFASFKARYTAVKPICHHRTHLA